MTRVCVDTSAYSHWKRGHSKVAEILDQAEWVGISCIVLGELYAGFARGRREERNLAELEMFLASPVVEQLPADGEVARIFGSIVMDLRRRGHPLPTNDIWIAATCARAGAALITFDSHFRAISRIGAVVFE
jgi:predicted nucleic acid-binding protein